MEIEEQPKVSNPHLPLPLHWEIVQLKNQGYTSLEIHKKLSVPESTISAIYHKYLNTGDIADLNKSGRPKKLNEREERMLVETVKSHSDTTILEIIDESNLDICKTTGWNLLKAHSFESKTSPVKWSMDDKRRKARLECAKKYICLDKNFLKKVIFSDESRVQYNKKKQKYWIIKETAVRPIGRDRWQDSLLIWGGQFHMTKIVC